MPSLTDRRFPLVDRADDAVPVHVVDAEGYADLLTGLPAAGAAFLAASGYKPKPGRIGLVPDATGAIAAVLLGAAPRDEQHPDRLRAGRLATGLPAGTYRFAGPLDDPSLETLAFVMGSYRFDRYRQSDDPGVRLVVPDGADRVAIERIAGGVFIARDLVNTPASDLHPAALADAALEVARVNGAEARVIVGDDLLTEGFPMIHAVGRASAVAPRLVDIAWGDQGDPKVTLVGKGVCFDTGGLDIKPSAGMLLMKKDMGGAAAALAAAFMIMSAGLRVRLRVLLPIVENAIAGSAFRPGDVMRSRKGLTVEIGNTDAEGRLILADALALADEEQPALILDYATLTGAARVALGPDLPPFYTDDDGLAGEIAAAAAAVADPVWRLPLWRPYEAMIESKIADLNNSGTGGFAGSVTAALFLRRFVSDRTPHAHFDIFAWTPAAKSARPEGGECQAARLTFQMLLNRYGAR